MTELATSSGSRILSKEISQKPQKLIDHSDYKIIKILPINSGDNITLDSVGGQESRFIIPGSYVFNLFNSYLSFREDSASVAGANNYYYRFADLIPHIQRFQILSSAGQVLLCDVPDCHKYTNAVLRHETRLDEMLETDQVTFRPDAATNQISFGNFEGLSPPQTIINTTLSSTAFTKSAAPGGNDPGDIASFVEQEINKFRTTNLLMTTSLPYYRTQGQAMKNKFIEPIYYLKNSASNKLVPIRNKLSLSLFKNTICAMNKNRYFGGDIEIKITWNKATNILFIAKTTPVDTAIDTPFNITISGLELNLAVENNPLIVNDMKTMFSNGGFNDFIPYLYVEKRVKDSAASHNITMDISRSWGQYLQKIIWFPANSFEAASTRYYHGLGPQFKDTVGGTDDDSDITNFLPAINSNPIYSSAIRYRDGGSAADPVLLNEAYILQRDRLKGSSITSADDYNYNFTWYQDWTEPSPKWMKPLEPLEPDVYIDGYRITDPIRYSIDVNFSVAGKRTHYLYAVMLRQLSVRPDGIALT